MAGARSTWKRYYMMPLMLVACGGDASTSGPSGLGDGDDIPTGGGATACTPGGDTTGWTFTRLGSGAKPALALDADGTAHVAFMNGSTAGWVRYVRLPAGSTTPETHESVDDGYFYGPIDVVLGSDSQPFVLYHDHTVEDQVLAIRGAGGSWSLAPMTNAGHDG